MTKRRPNRYHEHQGSGETDTADAQGEADVLDLRPLWSSGPAGAGQVWAVWLAPIIATDFGKSGGPKMGGLGSGRWGYGYPKRTTVEECRRLDVRTLRREGVLREGCRSGGTVEWRNSQGETIASVDLTATAAKIILRYWRQEVGATEWEEIGYRVPVVWTRYNFGGKRPFFLCPGMNCGRRVEILYLPLYTDAHYYLCRHCYGLSYESRQTWDKKVAFYYRHPELARAVWRNRKARSTDRLAAMEAQLKALKALEELMGTWPSQKRTKAHNLS